MFWRYNLVEPSHISTLLEREDVTLKDLMDEDDLLQECKAQNKKLIDFIIQPHVLEELVSLITEEPEVCSNDKVRYRYSNIACELLTVDIDAMNDALVSHKVLLDKLYNFLNTDKPLNPLLSSFFSKTIGLLFSKRTEKLFAFLQSKSNFLDLILRHIEISAIMDFLLKLLSCSTGEKDLRIQIHLWLNDQKIMQRLVGLIDPAFNKETNINAAYAICETVKSTREHMSLLQDLAEQEPLLDTIESTDVIAVLLRRMFIDDRNENVIISGISVLMALIEFKKHGLPNIQQVHATQNHGNDSYPLENAPVSFSFFACSDGSDRLTQLDLDRLSKGVKNTLNVASKHFEEFWKLLLNPPPKSAINLTTGRLEKPLGACRIEIARLFATIIASDKCEMYCDVWKAHILPVLLDLFFEYKWNNFFHTQVEHMVHDIVMNPFNAPSDTELIGNPLLDQLFSEYKITVKILECFERYSEGRNQAFQTGYMGHLTQIANHICQSLDNGVNGAIIDKKIKDISEEHYRKWEEFETGLLAKINNKNEQLLAGGIPISENTNLGAGDVRTNGIRGIENPYDSALPEVMQMPQNYEEQFPFSDDIDYSDSGQMNRSIHAPFLTEENMLQRNADLFEQMCRDRHQVQSTSDDIDEDVWEDKDNKPFSFRNRKSSDENSSDSEEENDMPSATTSTIIGHNDDVKMDIDNQEGWVADFENVPMDSAPVSIQNPWEGTEQPSSTSGDQENWADFGNFSNFATTSVDCSNEISSTTSIAMETSGSVLNTKFVSSSEISSTCDSTSGDLSVFPASNSSDLDRLATANVVCDRLLPDYGDSSCKTSESEAKPLNKCESKEFNARQNTSSLLERETCSSSTVHNGPV